MSWARNGHSLGGLTHTKIWSHGMQFHCFRCDSGDVWWRFEVWDCGLGKRFVLKWKQIRLRNRALKWIAYSVSFFCHVEIFVYTTGMNWMLGCLKNVLFHICIVIWWNMISLELQLTWFTIDFWLSERRWRKTFTVPSVNGKWVVKYQSQYICDYGVRFASFVHHWAE